VKTYPAVDIDSASELIFAVLDDFSPTAAEPRGDVTRVFFASSDARDAAADRLNGAGYEARVVDVPDEDWARRSQRELSPITVGRVTVVAPWHVPRGPGHRDPGRLEIVIAPSMGFGTGHHETTRLCLRALQGLELTGAAVVDAGTGSGVLAIAADRLGASAVLGIDNDPDAIQAARENLAWNPAATRTTFDVRDVGGPALPTADVITANLTGALLIRMADALAGAARPGGTLIVSGILAEEREEVRRAFARLALAEETAEGEWICLFLKRA
jgi:ribosomal protein L11 methyltransferase